MIAAASSLVILILVVGFVFADLFLDGEKMQMIDIPSYVGMDESAVTLDELDVEREYVFSHDVARGVVISQSHTGTCKIQIGSKYPLKIRVSLGERTSTLPNLLGMDIYEASGIIRELGCIPKTVFSESDAEYDTVILSTPSAGAEVREGDTVTIYVARGKPSVTVRVPDFYGCSLANIEAQVESAGLSLGKIEFIYSEDFLPDTVVYQSVGKNCLVKEGESVDFYVSRLPKS